MRPEKQHRRKRLEVFLWAAGLSYFFFAVRLYVGGYGPGHGVRWAQPDPIHYLSMAKAALVAVPMALGCGLLVCLFWRPKE
jgi:hypothetical protein